MKEETIGKKTYMVDKQNKEAENEERENGKE